MNKQLKGEKYIYALMAIELAKTAPEKRITIGRDTGMKGQQHLSRGFELITHMDKTFLVESKTDNNMVSHTRGYEYREYSNNIVIDAPTEWEN